MITNIFTNIKQKAYNEDSGRLILKMKENGGNYKLRIC